MRPAWRSLPALSPIREGGLHTAGTASQISDGATAAVLMSEDRAHELGYTPRARILAQTLIGAETSYLLDGPVDVARRLLPAPG